MLLRLVPRSFGRVVQQANRIYLRMLMVFLQPLHPHLSHDSFPSLRSLDLSSRVTLFPSPAADIKTKTEARKVLWLGGILYKSKRMCNLITSSPFTPEMILFEGCVPSANSVSYLTSSFYHTCVLSKMDQIGTLSMIVLFPCSLTVNLGTLGNINDALNCLK